ncbi:MAG: hypothetical protein JXR51_14600 [Bacteroidales bacterium]|nr:hypothetical protein [Bacteroidales bacterium]MBN2758400.1 hypothetical protein [Bacteroidales bacterium]
MSKLRFEKHNKKRKTWIFPLIVILLLYITIPVVLMSKGSSAIENTFKNLESDTVYTPSNEYFAGITFFETASVFPGFNKWANNRISLSKNKMLNIYKDKCNAINMKIYRELSNKELISTDLVFVKFAENNKTQINLICLNKDQNIEQEFIIPNSILTNYQSNFCLNWKVFFEKSKINQSELISICNKK